MKLEKYLLIDIETVPLHENLENLNANMQELWKKKSGIIAPELSDYHKSYETKAGIYAEFGKIICIGLGYFTEVESKPGLRIKTLFGSEEKSLLTEFTNICDAFFLQHDQLFCGHNIREFDIPYLCRRLMINQLKLPKVLQDLQQKKPWENPIADTLQMWKFGEYKNFVSVDLLSNILNIPSPKEDMDGSEVAQVYWQEKNLTRIAQYCSKDVATVGQLFLRLNNLPLIAEENIIFTS